MIMNQHIPFLVRACSTTVFIKDAVIDASDTRQRSNAHCAMNPPRPRTRYSLRPRLQVVGTRCGALVYRSLFHNYRAPPSCRLQQAEDEKMGCTYRHTGQALTWRNSHDFKHSCTHHWFISPERLSADQSMLV